MVSLRKQISGDSWQLRVTAKGKRIILPLPDLTEAQANRWKLFVQASAGGINYERPIDRKTNEWIASLDRKQWKKLWEKNPIEADEEEIVEVEISLDHYQSEYFNSRKAHVKDSTWIFYLHARKRLIEYFPGRSLRSIIAIEAKQFRKWLEDSNKRDKLEEGEKAKPLMIDTTK